MSVHVSPLRIAHSRGLFAWLLVAILFSVIPLAHSLPPDPSWIAGLYDDADHDDAIALLSYGEAFVLRRLRVARESVDDACAPAWFCALLVPLVLKRRTSPAPDRHLARVGRCPVGVRGPPLTGGLS